MFETYATTEGDRAGVGDSGDGCAWAHSEGASG